MRHFLHILSLPGKGQYKVLQKLESVPNILVKLSIILPVGQEQTPYMELASQLKEKGQIENFELLGLAQDTNYHALLNKRLLACPNKNSKDYLFFLSPNISLEKNCLEKLLAALKTEGNLAGICPTLLADWPGAEKQIACAGITVDCQKKLHYLYEGLSPSNPLAAKKRLFQFAYPGALLIRKEDFIKIGGFPTALELLSFPSFCLNLKKLGYDGFTFMPEAQAYLDNPFDSWEFCGTWNSILQHGRLDAKLLLTDYPVFALQDGLEYKIDDWLNEAANLEQRIDQANPWLQWRYHPQPLSLLKYLSSLPENLKVNALEFARNLPASLPKVYEYYLVQAEKILTYAQNSNLKQLEKEIFKWQKRKSRFHHGLLKAGIKLLKEAGIYNFSLDHSPAIFDAWVEIAEKKPRVELKKEFPEISVIMPVWNPEPKFLIEAIDSVLAQSYPKWQFCIADDASTNPEIREILRSYANKDKRIKISFREQNGHICRASNSALELATAPYAAFLDHDDLLSTDALALNAELIAKKSELKYIYSDEDHLDENNVRRSPIYRADYDEDLFFVGHLTVLQLHLIRKIGAFRPGFEGSQDNDLQRRVSELIKPDHIQHIPHILYHWRVHEKSTAASLTAKPYILEATKKVLLETAQRQGYQAELVDSPRNNYFRLLYKIPKDLSASIIVYGDEKSVKVSRQLLSYLEGLATLLDIEIFVETASKSWIENCYNGIPKCKNKILAFLYAGLIPDPQCRLEQLIIMAARQDLAVTSGLIWHGEYLYNGGFYPDITGYPFPLLQGFSRDGLAKACWGQFLLARHVLGISKECMLIKREILEKEKFLDAAFRELAPLDFCLHQYKKGRASLISPWGQWSLDNITPSSPSKKDFEAIHDNWGEVIKHSGLRNPSLKASSDMSWTLIL